ncbi:MAG TPA: carboxypeptidase-like regulatory domain-containing protein, partial [Bacteroidia bacterium]|nr:carboxypeptidase-like regulatory domain-containing protein [Bacteroidia bacterium]
MLKSTFAIALIVGCVISVNSLAQSPNNCNLTLSGIVTGADSNKPLFYVAVDLLQLSKGVYTDRNGAFALNDLCPGQYHVELFQIGYAKVDTLIDIESNRKIRISLKPDNVNLTQVNITSNKIEKESVQTLDQTSLSGAQLEQTRGEVLGDALKSIAGVDVISTGPTIIKPVIHGLYSNRILILNNGVPQEGQQWGTEHA